MPQILYTPIGDMVHQIDFYDQPADPAADGGKAGPVLFAEDVYAKIEALWTTTQARKFQQQVLTETSHRITIRYRPGLSTRMFIKYNHPDAGEIRLDIDSINDPDFKRVELQILAIARNDGK
jgi:head-tail adaptor